MGLLSQDAKVFHIPDTIDWSFSSEDNGGHKIMKTLAHNRWIKIKATVRRGY